MDKCSATGKIIFESKGVALDRLSRIKSHRKYASRKRNKKDFRLKRVYHCESCNGYHFTSWDKYIDKPIVPTEIKNKDKFTKYLSND